MGGRSLVRPRELIGRGDPVVITDAGLNALGNDYAPLPSGQALIDHWLANAGGKAERLILLALIGGPSAMGIEDVAEATGYASSGGGFRNALSRLRTLELIQPGSPIRLHADFQEAIS